MKVQETRPIAKWAARPGWLLAACFVSGLCGAAAFGGVSGLLESDAEPQTPLFADAPPVSNAPTECRADFTYAAQLGSPSVVFIKTVSSFQNRQDNYWGFWDFFGHSQGPISSAGSGVVLSSDGYIVTNNHVIDRAEQITVVLQNKRSFAARVVGVDPSTDLALLKVEATGLPAIQVANSDGIRIGEWVLAVGNPLNLTSTVTAGIVSAKGRNINIVNSLFPIESFIQTDAAINPGNSGGALLNQRGELVGINTAIKSETGAYSGYGFAIPSNIVQKVVKDLKDFGSVQQAFIGAEAVDIDEVVARNLGTNDYSGVYVESVLAGGAADAAGLRVGDVVLKLDGVPVETRAHFLERLAFRRPGDKVRIAYRRAGAVRETEATLTNREGTTAVLRNTTTTVAEIGADVAPLSLVERQRLSVDGGWRLTNIKPGPIARLGLKEGFVVLKVGGQTPGSPEHLRDLLLGSRGRVTIEGLDANGQRVRFQFLSY